MTRSRPVRIERIWLMMVTLFLAFIVLTAFESGVLGAELPRLVLLDANGLFRTKERLQNRDPAFAPAFARLKDDAGRALDVKPPSVTEKNLSPPSGDKHDYMSIAPYWWPNPATPNGLPFIRRDGEVNPERDRRSDRGRLETMIQTVEPLALGYFFTEREDYAAHAAELLRVWFLDPATKMNPRLTYAQAVPGQNTGRGAGIIETHDLSELIDFISLLNGSKAWSARDHQRWQDWNKEYLSWLVESPEGKAEARAENNHGTWYDVQVAALAIPTARDELAKEILSDFHRKRIIAQVDADGRQPRELSRTRAWDYSVFNLEAFFDAASMAANLSIDLWSRSDDQRSIRQALDWLVPFVTGERKWTYPQMLRFRPEKLAPLLRRAAIIYREPAYEKTLERLPRVGSERWQLLYPKIPGVR
ncbi:MAG TPA: alginate lyase family protein [Candidatus Binatia bacterium]